tara:strand:- start:180 stop:2339 length:2160 start_codon:yes stop_codon:yes gene_type:complete
MPSTVYKGDLAEVSFAPETGLKIRSGTDAVMTLANSGNITTITFSVEANTVLFEDASDTATTKNALRYPKNMLVGSQVVWAKEGSTAALNVGDLPDTGNGGRIFTIVENDGTTMKISPVMLTSGALGVGDVLHILPYKTPPMDVSMKQSTFALQGTESVKTDQFLGIATALTLPETKIDLKRFHVVGLGRDATIQVPGKLITEGGSFEVAMHSARWLKYCLGHDLISKIQVSSDSDLTPTLSSATDAGQSHVVVSAAGGDVVVGTYIEIHDPSSLVPIVSDHEPDGSEWDGELTDDIFDKAASHEIRRIIGISENDNTLYLDEPLTYPHAAGLTCEIRKIGDADTECVAIANGTITFPMTHIIYSRTTQPSFSLEVSQRRRDIDSNEGDTNGGVTDSKELTRVFRGCKVTDWTMTTDNDAALRLSVNFNAALCYTDTGRLTPYTVTVAGGAYNNDPTITHTATVQTGLIVPGMVVTSSGAGIPTGATVLSVTDTTHFELSASTTTGAVSGATLTLTAPNGMTRYSAHRMFDDTASTDNKRLESGIGKGTQKPFMFYNGSIKLAGQQVAQVLSMTLTGQTGMQSFHTINGNNQSASAYADQVPFGGARNASLMVEGQTTYEMTMEIAVDDPLFYHKMRTGTEFSVSGEGVSTNQIRIEFEKNLTGSTAAGASEKMVILIDDYYIVEAPLQIPEDKGVVKSTLKIMPKAVKVLARDSILKY